MIEIKDLGFGVIAIFDKDTQYAPAQSIKIENTTYIREDLINKQIADLQHKLKVANRALELACDHIPCVECPHSDGKSFCYIASEDGSSPNEWECNTAKYSHYLEQAEAEINERSNNE